MYVGTLDDFDFADFDLPHLLLFDLPLLVSDTLQPSPSSQPTVTSALVSTFAVVAACQFLSLLSNLSFLSVPCLRWNILYLFFSFTTGGLP